MLLTTPFLGPPRKTPFADLHALRSRFFGSSEWSTDEGGKLESDHALATGPPGRGADDRFRADTSIGAHGATKNRRNRKPTRQKFKITNNFFFPPSQSTGIDIVDLCADLTYTLTFA